MDESWANFVQNFIERSLGKHFWALILAVRVGELKVLHKLSEDKRVTGTNTQAY
jgi:hypothetical protein